ncbi:hypothetical protein [Streptomyces sp. JB150]|uniref:hypothetical protein n=1 Tax=Streptomyces sp. JB150 TaxID=2714844 RepID=UPI001409B124|nr:hypothetical protein [Streptomyces sp. JB150]QIJ61066.1 hypothetical protein G7Z13_02740 [Streptomyces sp. JB150]
MAEAEPGPTPSGTARQTAATAAGPGAAAGDKAVINGPVFNDPLSGPADGAIRGSPPSTDWYLFRSYNDASTLSNAQLYSA